MPLQPTFINNEHAHYYMDYGGEEENPMDTEGKEREDNANETLAPVNPLDNTPVLGQLLKLPVERM